MQGGQALRDQRHAHRVRAPLKRVGFMNGPPSTRSRTARWKAAAASLELYADFPEVAAARQVLERSPSLAELEGAIDGRPELVHSDGTV